MHSVEGQGRWIGAAPVDRCAAAMGGLFYRAAVCLGERRAAFGQDHGKAAIDQIYPDNAGAHQIKEGAEFDVLPIDSLGVTDCDLLQLDVEGYEHLAILGALATIEASWPVITLELKGHGERYGYTDNDTINLLADMGYKIADRVNRDVIFTK